MHMLKKVINSHHWLLMHVGPIRNTLVDHWRMIWQEHSHTIVMVTNIKEGKKIKCQQYWPEHDSEDFGPFRITLSDQKMFANFTIRLLQVEVSPKEHAYIIVYALYIYIYIYIYIYQERITSY